MQTIEEYQEAEIRALLTGRCVAALEDGFVLDDGTVVHVEANVGDETGGRYEVTHLEGIPEAIVDVELAHEMFDSATDDEAHRYSIVAYSAKQRVVLLSVEGSDGDGVGTGYTLTVEEAS